MAKQYQGIDWTAEQLELQGWLALPQRHREPNTQRALAKKLGVNEFTLSRWKALPGFGEEVVGLARNRIKLEDLNRVLDAMVKKAIDHGDVQAARLVYECVGALPSPTRSRQGRPRVEVILEHG